VRTLRLARVQRFKASATAHRFVLRASSPFVVSPRSAVAPGAENHREVTPRNDTVSVEVENGIGGAPRA